MNFHIGVPSIYQNIVFSESSRPIELKFHFRAPYDKLAKIYTIFSGHMIKMSTMTIYGKKPLKSSSPEPEA